MTGEKKDMGEMPEESVLASMAIDNLKIEKIVQEFFRAQSLKILPQAPFGDAVSQFVEKDDKHALELFVNDSLSTQVKSLLDLEDDDIDLDEVMERIRAKQEEGFKAGTLRRARKGKLKPRPLIWDSDLDGKWEDQPGAYEYSEVAEDEESETATSPTRRGRVVMSEEEDELPTAPPKKAPAKRARAKRGPAKASAKASAKAPAKRAPAKRAPAKAPAKGRGKKAVVISDNEDEDIIMFDEEPPRTQPRRAAVTRSAGRQTQLDFSQIASQPKELSDDEISDDDDAFEPMPTTTRQR
jgi:double-strand break repair protein MRE11